MKENKWDTIPLLRIVPIFIGGILFGAYSEVGLAMLIWLSLVPVGVITMFYFFSNRLYSYKRRWFNGAAFYAAMFLCGSILTVLHKETNYFEHFSHKKGLEYVGWVAEPLKEKAKSYRTVLKITGVKTVDGWEKTTGNCLAYLAKDKDVRNLRYGDLLFFTVQPNEVLAASNPSQFDYKEWLSRNKIYNQVFIPSASQALLARHCGNRLLDYAFDVREKCLSIFKDNNLDGQEYAVLSALLLGDEHAIDQETISAYQASGVLHVLSVSGMHVGIIYLALNFLLGFLNKKRGGKIFKAVVIVIALWLYAAITGLAPAVLRSATMLSFMVFGSLRKNPASIYNSLLASCVFLLLINPFYIMQASFQLSYLAVAGIVLFQRKIKSMVETGNFILGKVWDIVSVSFAAQLATFPLSLLYFHQFPNYFIFSNLLIIPLSSAIIYGGILLLLVSPLHIVSVGLGAVLSRLLYFLNDSVARIENLPLSTIRGISISVAETWMIYLLLAFFMFYIVKKEAKFLVAAFIICVVIFASQIAEAFSQKQQRLITIYNVPKKTAIAFTTSRQYVFLEDKSLVVDKSEMQFQVYQDCWEKGIGEENVVCCYDTSCFNSSLILMRKNFIDFAGVRIFWLNERPLLSSAYKQGKVDFIIFSKNVNVSLQEVVEKISAKKVIFDSSNSQYKVNQWVKEAKKLNIHYHSVMQQGAFIYSLN
jgi:competence protein ComEC